MGRTKTIVCGLLAYLLNVGSLGAATLEVGKGHTFIRIKSALLAANTGDTVLVHSGFYREGTLVVDKPLSLIGIDKPVVDGEKKVECLTIRSDSVLVKGFKVTRSGYASLDDPAGIKLLNSQGSVIRDNELEDNFFGIYLSHCRNCRIENNILRAYGLEEQQIGNGIHCWKSDSLQIIANRVNGHRDGIYFEFVTQSLIWRNTSFQNIRYGLHFMFSNNDTYITNIFRKNGAGVAVMYSHHVSMLNNYFAENWGDAAFGILLKEIADSEIRGNRFVNNTAALYLEGASRMRIVKNTFRTNGWALKIQASCMDNEVVQNNFFSNTFDCSTNGDLVLNSFQQNYWDHYEGYDLNRDGIGDIPFHPLSLFNVIVEKNPPVMLLFRSFMVNLLDQSERVLPSLTPENFKDEQPAMKPLAL